MTAEAKLGAESVGGTPRVCVATALPRGILVSFRSFVYPAKLLWAFRCGFTLRETFPGRAEPPHPRQVQRRGGQRKLRSYFSQPAHPESPHPSLLFQNSDDRFSQRFP